MKLAFCINSILGIVAASVAVPHGHIEMRSLAECLLYYISMWHFLLLLPHYQQRLFSHGHRIRLLSFVMER